MTDSIYLLTYVIMNLVRSVPKNTDSLQNG